MAIALGGSGEIARVKLISVDKRSIYVEYRNGFIVEVNSSAPFPLAVGDIVLVRDNPLSVVKTRSELWPKASWVGVVRLKLDDVTVIDTSGNLRLVPTSIIEYRQQNTVEGTDDAGVARVLSEEPIRIIDLPSITDEVVQKFKVEKSSLETFDDFGGMKRVLNRVQEIVETQLKYQEKLKEIGARPVKGVLFTGEPGTGKTMLARIIANQAGAAFYDVSGPQVISKWYGESEELLRKIFEDAQKQDRAIIFFDEIDSIASQRSDESNEASRRVVAQLLTLMDGFKAKGNVVLIAATNRPQDIDRALRRPGRFDWEIHFDLPDETDRADILKAATRRINVSEPLPHQRVAQLTDGWSAAELAEIWSEAAILAAKENRGKIYEDDYWGGLDRVRTQRLEKRSRSSKEDS